MANPASTAAPQRDASFRGTWSGPVIVFAAAFVASLVLTFLPIQGRGLPLACGLGVASLAWYLAWHQLRLAWIIADTPTVAIKAASIGRIEVQGRLVTQAPVEARFTGVPTLYCEWQIEEYQRALNGKRSWVTVAEGTDVAPNCYVYDDTGSLWVTRLDAAEVRCPDNFSTELPDSKPRRRHSERTLANNAEVYVLGNGQLLAEAPVLAIGPQGDTPFLVSGKSEHYERRRSLIARWAMVLTGLAYGLLGVMFTIAGTREIGQGRRMVHYVPVSNARTLALIFAAVYVGAFVVVYLIRQYNRLVDVRLRAERAWSLIDVQLVRRAELIPQLVETVRGYATFELDLQIAIAYRRSTGPLPDAEQVDAATRVASAQRHVEGELLALAEHYPQLEASENFRSLQSAIIDAEQRIAMARRFYNDALQAWQDRSRVFPWSLLARLVRGPVLEYFRAEAPIDAPAVVLPSSPKPLA